MAKKEGLTPMMQQYIDMKEKNPDCLLFFRLGDFYEMFFEDAQIASRELEIVLTGRDCGLKEKAPMCGVPYHSASNYINRLIEKGYRVAICEQLTDPKDSKGIVERGVVRIISSGTVIEENMLDEQKNNYIMALHADRNTLGVAYADVSTGAFFISECEATSGKLQDVLAQIQTSEIVCKEEMSTSSLFHNAGIGLQKITTKFGSWAFEYSTAYKNMLTHFQVNNLVGFGCEELQAGICAAGALIAYLNETQKNAMVHINQIHRVAMQDYMMLDATTRRNLELTQSMQNTKNKKGTVFGLLNKTKTAMGARTLRNWIEAPLGNRKDIELRNNAVEELFQDSLLRETLQDSINQVYDLERICGKIAYSTANARDALALKQSLEVMPALYETLNDTKNPLFKQIYERFDTMQDVYQLLDLAIALEPPIGLKDGGIIREGYNESLDALQNASDKAQEWLQDLEAKEREETGIKNLKIRYNKVFGYYIEVTKSYLSNVPFRYQRKQTLANAERYITDELKQLEVSLLGASEKSIALEYSIFCKIRDELEKQIPRIQALASQIAQLDVLQSLAQIACEQNYVKPTMHDDYDIEILGGRHPVVEMMGQGQFVDNDTHLTSAEYLAIITGPNMAGKSTYMRQVALICLFAHIGSFVPANSANIPIIDRIFTRVGASDDLASGQSTFMMEMSETANILNNATRRSLLIMDEIGRGTSTFDGLSIAWAVCEFIADTNVCGAKTLFATHYHELSTLENSLDGVVNYRVTVKEIGSEVVFLRKVVRGGTDKSFGIYVAKIAGIPNRVIHRAEEILEHLEASDLNHDAILAPSTKQFEENVIKANPVADEIMQELRSVNSNAMTPIEALLFVAKLQDLTLKNK